MVISSVNGVISAAVSVLDRGLAYGDGVFESMRLVRGKVPLWHYHQQRLSEGCQRLAIPLPLTQVRSWLDDLVAALPTTSVERCSTAKLIVTRGSGGRGYRPDPALAPSIIISLYAGDIAAAPPVALQLCNYRLPANPLLAGIKHLNRLDNVMLQLECDAAGMADGLVLDTRDQVIETTSANVFFERQGQLFTPLLNECGVSGVMRRFILDELAPAAQIPAIESSIPVAGLDTYSAAFCCNSVRGLTPISRIGEVAYSQTPLLQKLQLALLESRFEKGE